MLQSIQKRHLTDGGDFSATGLITSVPSSPDTFNPGKAVLATRVAPSGATIYLSVFSANVIDIGNADQIYFAIMRNGIAVQAGLERIQGVQFQYQPQYALDIYVPPGLIEIWAFNISGMLTSIEPKAIAGVAVQCQAWWRGNLLSERGGIR